MNLLNDYQKFTASVAVYPDEVNQAGYVVYLPLGIADEAGELCEKISNWTSGLGGQSKAPYRHEILAEIGDVMWYVTRWLDEKGHHLNDHAFAVYNGIATVDHIALYVAARAGYICGRTKKMLRDGRNWSDEQWNANNSAAILAAEDIIAALTTLCRFFSSSMLEVLHDNQKKLESRKDRGKLGGDGDKR